MLRISNETSDKAIFSFEVADKTDGTITLVRSPCKFIELSMNIVFVERLPLTIFFYHIIIILPL